MRTPFERLNQGLVESLYVPTSDPLNHRNQVALYQSRVANLEAIWLGNIACRSTDLDNVLADLREAEGPEVKLSVLGRTSWDQASWQAAREADAKDLNKFQTACGPLASIETFECRLPSFEVVEQCIRDMNGFNSAQVYLEMPTNDPGAVDESSFLLMVDALVSIAEFEWVHAKLDLDSFGGQAVDLRQIAQFVHQCVSLEIPFKLSGGRVGGVSQFEREVAAETLGLWNIFYSIGACLDHDATESEVLAILKSDLVSDWTMEPTFSYKGLPLSGDALDEVRTFFVSYQNGANFDNVDSLRLI